MMAEARAHGPLYVFISYSHQDERFRRELEKHLTQLQHDGLIQQWHDRKISAGQGWEGTIDKNLARAHIVLLLISPDFIASRYCYDIEMQRAMRRHKAGRACVIPVILRPCDWQSAPFGRLQALPTDGKPVTKHRPHDAAWLEVARGLREVARTLQMAPALAEPPKKVTSARPRGSAARDPAKAESPAKAPPRPSALTGGQRNGRSLPQAALRPPMGGQLAKTTPATSIDEALLVNRTRALIPADRYWASGHAQLCLVVASGPARQVLRPSELEDKALADKLMKDALFGRTPIFVPNEKTEVRREGDALVLVQETASLRVDEAGTVRLLLSALSPDTHPRSLLLGLIEEDIRSRIERSLRFSATVLNHVDRPKRLTDLVIIAGLLGAGSLSWRTRAEQEASPNSATMGHGAERIVVPERPHLLPRATFVREISSLADDLTVLLRREVRG